MGLFKKAYMLRVLKGSNPLHILFYSNSDREPPVIFLFVCGRVLDVLLPALFLAQVLCSLSPRMICKTLKFYLTLYLPCIFK
jgi:hypothetical protein